MRTLSFLMLAFFASILLAAPAAAQSGKYELFGATCKGTGKGPGATCLSANVSGKLQPASIRDKVNFALQVNSGPTVKVVTGYELMGYSRVGKTLYLQTWLYDAAASGAPGKILRRGTMNMTTTKGWHKTSFKPILIKPNTTFFLVFHSVWRFRPSIVFRPATMVNHYWNGPPNWRGPFPTPWAYKVNCGTSSKAGASLLLTVDNVPKIGKTFVTELHYAKPGGALHVIGVSNTKWGPLKLPFFLTAFGAPRCAVNVSGDIILALPVSGSGFGKVSFGIPNNPVLAGGVFFQQFVSLDAGANTLGVALSNGGKATVGK